MTVSFLTRLKQATSDDERPQRLIIGNFEVEERWAAGRVTLPRLQSDEGASVVRRMDELAVLLGEDGDVVLVKEAPDADYLRYLGGLGFPLPTIVTPAAERPETSVTQDALEDEATLARLRELGRHAVVAHGISDLEVALAERAGLAVAAPPLDVIVKVNSKVYSRRLADELGIAQPAGWAFDSVEGMEAVAEEAAAALAEGPLVLKEAYGVSGKGLAVVDSPQRLRRLLSMIAKKAKSSGGSVEFVIERWLSKDRDFNYQFVVGRDGSVRFDFVKEALTAQGVHRGHRFPARLTAEQVATIEETAQLIGRRLAEEGFYGVVGVDAITDTDDRLFPLLEINARNNMSTYQLPIQERLMQPGQVALARHYPVRLPAGTAFGTVAEALGDALLAPGARSGAVIHNFSTVGAAGATGEGRLYALLIADDDQQIDQLDALITDRLAALQEQHA